MSSEGKNFSVDLRTMADRTKKLNDELDHLKRMTAQLEEALAVMKTMWSGCAADAFYQSIAADIGLIEAFTASGDKAVHDHEYALSVYKEIEQRSADIVNAIQI